MARRESPVDFLERKPTRQRQQPEAPKLILPEHCEIRGCTSGKNGSKGKPEVAIHDTRGGGTLGYACQWCYQAVLSHAGKSGSALADGSYQRPPQRTFADQRNAQHVADILGGLSEDWDRYADSMAGRVDED